MRRQAARVGWPVVALLALLAVAFVAISWGRISAPFGDSDEGINTSVWAYNSRSLREAGPVSSALGGRRLDGTDYATHPPMIVIETAIAETIAGEHEPASRAPAWIGSIVALVLLYRISRSLGADPLASAAATVAVGATPMLFGYGVMLDTPVTSLPFGLAVALVWYRDWRATSPDDPGGFTPPNPWLAAGLSALAALAGWQAGLLAGICGATLLVRAARRRPGALRAALPYLGGAVVGLGLSIAWGFWVYGSLSALQSKLQRRSGSSGGVSPIDVVTFQMPWLFQLLGLAVVGLVACAVSLRDKVYRPLAALSLGIVGLYCLLFREAAAGHQYWVYWSLFPAAVGLTYAFAALQRSARNAGLSANAAGGAIVGLALLVGVIDVARGSDALVLMADGEAPVEQLQRLTLPPGDAVYYVGQQFRPDSWILYYTGRHGQALHSDDEVARLARDQPDAPVLVLGVCDDGDIEGAAFCRRVTGPSDASSPSRSLRASELARERGIQPAAPASQGGPPPLPPPTLSAP